jgi:hypothetical protein
LRVKQTCKKAVAEKEKLEGNEKDDFYLFVEMPQYDTVSTKKPGANVIKLFTTLISWHSMFILTFCDIKPYCLHNYHGMAVI